MLSIYKGRIHRAANRLFALLGALQGDEFKAFWKEKIEREEARTGPITPAPPEAIEGKMNRQYSELALAKRYLIASDSLLAAGEIGIGKAATILTE